MQLSKKDYRFFEFARREAINSDYKKIHIGCVIVYKGHIIGKGSNSTKTDTIQKKYNNYRNFNNVKKPVSHSIHAEIAALKSISYPIQSNIDWKKVSVYIYRICLGKALGRGIARPCQGCMKALKDIGIQHIYYSTEDGFAYEKIF